MSAGPPAPAKSFVYLIQVQMTAEALWWLNARSTSSSDVVVLVWGEGEGGALCFDRTHAGGCRTCAYGVPRAGEAPAPHPPHTLTSTN
jgi:hypothetical protein